MVNYEFGTGLWMFQQFVDCYATDAYGPPVSTPEAIERAATSGDIKVLEINYPFAGSDVIVAQVRETLQRTGLRAQAITPHLYMREFRENPVQAAQASIRTIRGMESLLDRLDRSAINAAQEQHDALNVQQIVLDALLGITEGSK